MALNIIERLSGLFKLGTWGFDDKPYANYGDATNEGQVEPEMVLNDNWTNIADAIEGLGLGNLLQDNSILSRHIADSQLLIRHISPELQDMMIQGVSASVQFYSDLPATVDTDTIYIVKETDSSGDSGFYKFDGSVWNKIADYVSNADMNLKQDKVTGAVEDNVATWDSAGNTKDSGTPITDITDNLGKMKVATTDTTFDFLDLKLEFGNFGNTSIPKGINIISGTGYQKIQMNPISPVDYIVDNATDLELALDDIRTTGIGATVYCKKGTYNAGHTLIVPSVDNVAIISDNSAIFTFATYPIFQDGDTGSGVYHNNHSYIGLSFDGSGAGGGIITNYNSANPGLYKTSNMIIRDLKIKRTSYATGWFLDINCAVTRISNCFTGINGNINFIKTGYLYGVRIFNIENRGKLFESVSNGFISNTEIFGNTYTQYGYGTPIKINSISGGNKKMKIYNNFIDANGSKGVKIIVATDGAGNGYLNYLRVYNNDYNGAYFTGISDVDDTTIGGTYILEHNNEF